jgi:hypothetical protein
MFMAHPSLLNGFDSTAQSPVSVWKYALKNRKHNRTGEKNRPDPVGLKPPGETEGRKNLIIVLAFKLFGPINMGEGRFDLSIAHGNPGTQIRDKKLAVDTVAVPEGVPVQKDIP